MVFYERISFFDDSNISLGILCCFRFLSNAVDTRPGSLEFRFHGSLSAAGLRRKIHGCAGSYACYNYN
jgi:hypothetical protein